jgi:protein CpxP
MSQTKYKWMVFLVFILLLSNMVLAFFLFFANDKKSRKKENGEDWAMKIYNEIGLDSMQIVIFKKEKDIFFETMRPVWNENRQAKENLYKKLASNSSDTSVLQLLSQIERTNHYSDSFTFTHFVKLRSMCTPEQQVRFDTIIPKLVLRQRNRR